jgi:hypothetical protein
MEELMGTGVLSSMVKWPGCEADYSSASSADVKKVYGCTSTPVYVCMW